jgi:non-canonical purine NTP pyrophosphatase (RdgB/HAM1 family)
MSTTLIFATSNKGKFAWLERSLKIAGLFDTAAVMKKMDLVEIQSESLEEISLYKAQQAYALLKQPVLVMDGGFYIHELNGFPGPFVRYMIDMMGVHAIAKLAGTLTDASCLFKNVVTYMDENGNPTQFYDDTGNIYTLSSDVWPHDHPDQWSSMWRILIPTGMGYTKPLAALDEKSLQQYAEERARRDEDNSALNKLVEYLKDRQTSAKKFGT